MKKISTGLVVAASAIATQAHAAAGDVDLTPLTSVFKAEQIVTGVLAVAAVLMTVYVAKKAVSMIIGMVRG